jgi:hypothetical protein
LLLLLCLWFPYKVNLSELAGESNKNLRRA